MKEVEFRRPQLEDKETLSYYFKKYPSRSCERTFVNVYLWSKHYRVKYAIIENALVFRSEDEGVYSFAYPAGEPEDVKRAIEFLKEYCEERDQEFNMYCVTPGRGNNLIPGIRDNMRLNIAEMMRTIYTRQKSLPHFPGKSFMQREIILINSKQSMRTGLMNR